MAVAWEGCYASVQLAEYQWAECEAYQGHLALLFEASVASPPLPAHNRRCP